MCAQICCNVRFFVSEQSWTGSDFGGVLPSLRPKLARSVREPRAATLRDGPFGSAQAHLNCCAWALGVAGPKKRRPQTPRFDPRNLVRPDHQTTGCQTTKREANPSAGCSLPEFMNFKLFEKTILVVNKSLDFFGAIHSAGEDGCGAKAAKRMPQASHKELKAGQQLRGLTDEFPPLAGLGWLGLIGLGWVLLGLVGLGWVGLGWAGLGWVGLGGVGWGWPAAVALCLCLAWLGWLCSFLEQVCHRVTINPGNSAVGGIKFVPFQTPVGSLPAGEVIGGHKYLNDVHADRFVSCRLSISFRRCSAMVCAMT